MAAPRLIFFSILILCAFFFLSDSNSESEARSRVRRAFDSMSKESLTKLLNILGAPIHIILDLLECVEQEVPYLNCNFNFSIDLFYVVKQCSLKSDDLKILFDKIEKAIPPIKSNLAVPPIISKEVCFGGIPPNLLASSSDYLNAMPFGSDIAAEAGLFGIALRDVLDVTLSKVYTLLRTVLSFGTRVDVPPPM